MGHKPIIIWQVKNEENLLKTQELLLRWQDDDGEEDLYIKAMRTSPLDPHKGPADENTLTIWYILIAPDDRDPHSSAALGVISENVMIYLPLGKVPSSNNKAQIWWVPAIAIHSTPAK